MYARNGARDGLGGGGGPMAPGRAMTMDPAPAALATSPDAGLALGKEHHPGFFAGEPQPGSPGPDLAGVAARKNLNETAFFFPHLVSDAEGAVRMEFTMPEALTKWKFMGFAHDRELRSGSLTDELVTAKDLMAEPNPPRFLREGDNIEFPVQVSNRSATRQQGKVRISLKDARTEKPLDADFG